MSAISRVKRNVTDAARAASAKIKTASASLTPEQKSAFAKEFAVLAGMVATDLVTRKISPRTLKATAAILVHAATSLVASFSSKSESKGWLAASRVGAGAVNVASAIPADKKARLIKRYVALARRVALELMSGKLPDAKSGAHTRKLLFESGQSLLAAAARA